MRKKQYWKILKNPGLLYPRLHSSSQNSRGVPKNTQIHILTGAEHFWVSASFYDIGSKKNNTQLEKARDIHEKRTWIRKMKAFFSTRNPTPPAPASVRGNLFAMQKHSKILNTPFSRSIGASEKDARKLHALYFCRISWCALTHEVLCRDDSGIYFCPNPVTTGFEEESRYTDFVETEGGGNHALYKLFT